MFETHDIDLLWEAFLKTKEASSYFRKMQTPYKNERIKRLRVRAARELIRCRDLIKQLKKEIELFKQQNEELKYRQELKDREIKNIEKENSKNY